MKQLLVLFLSLVCSLFTPALFRDSMGKSCLPLTEPASYLYPGTYITAWDRVLKTISLHFAGEQEGLNVSVWQDHYGNLHFTDNDEKAPEDADSFVIREPPKGLFLMETWHVYLGLLATLGFYYLLFKKLILAKGNSKTKTLNIKSSVSSRSMPEAALHSACLVLGVKADDSPSTIKSAYKKLMSQYHPDKVASMAPELQQVAREKTALINQAYDTICERRNLKKQK